RLGYGGWIFREAVWLCLSLVLVIASGSESVPAGYHPLSSSRVAVRAALHAVAEENFSLTYGAQYGRARGRASGTVDPAVRVSPRSGAGCGGRKSGGQLEIALWRPRLSGNRERHSGRRLC